MEKDKTIPFMGKTMVGNFSLRRMTTTIDGERIEQIVVANTDGSWQVRIPQWSDMFTILTDMYAKYAEDGDSSMFMTFFTNMSCVSTIPNGYYQQLVMMVNTAYADPSLLRIGGRGHRAFMKDVNKVVKALIAWHKEYDKLQKDFTNDKDTERTERALQIMEKE